MFSYTMEMNYHRIYKLPVILKIKILHERVKLLISGLMLLLPEVLTSELKVLVYGLSYLCLGPWIQAHCSWAKGTNIQG